MGAWVEEKSLEGRLEIRAIVKGKEFAFLSLQLRLLARKS
jgi:hypothetical protein